MLHNIVWQMSLEAPFYEGALGLFCLGKCYRIIFENDIPDKVVRNRRKIKFCTKDKLKWNKLQ